MLIYLNKIHFYDFASRNSSYLETIIDGMHEYTY
jgi:hypothetical protein